MDISGKGYKSQQDRFYEGGATWLLFLRRELKIKL
jgi:hypothetical protein